MLNAVTAKTAIHQLNMQTLHRHCMTDPVSKVWHANMLMLTHPVQKRTLVFDLLVLSAFLHRFDLRHFTLFCPT